jgi:SpoVK/Ycf46/Vps4 family AAA+-type ATPase
VLAAFVIPKSLLVKREMGVRASAVATAGVGAVSTMALRPFFINPHVRVHVRRYMTTVRRFLSYLTHSRVSLAMLISALAGLVLSLPLGLWSLLALVVSSVGVLVGVYAAAYVSDLDTLKSLFGGILVDVPNEQELEELFKENWLVLIGMDELKDRLVKASMAFEDIPGVRPIHGMLLYGPAGTGKTALGIGYAAWLGLNKGFNVFIVRAGRILRGGPFDAAHRLDLIFQLAEAYQPAVVYIDEIDALGRVRESPDAPTYLTTSVLLQDIDGIVSRYAKVLVIGTTNNKDVLDPALVRPGRLGDMLIYVAKPPKELVKRIILGIAEQKRVTIPGDLLDKASETLETGADAESFVNCVALKERLGLESELPECLKAVSSGLPAY